MREINRSTKFKRDYKRELKKTSGRQLNEVLVPIFSALADDQKLPDKHRDHDLIGDLKGYRECHIKPDLLLIYRKVDTEAGKNFLHLARLGSHSELFG